MTDLLDCRYRETTGTAGVFCCRHPCVHARHDEVCPAICDGCGLREPALDGVPGQPVVPTSHLRALRIAAKAHADPCPANPCVETAVTLGVVTFNRPDSLVRLVRSVRRHYPTLRIIVADNGSLRADLAAFGRLNYLELPFDCGLSASRNRIVENLDTPFLLLVDDDFEFTEQTILEYFVEVLHFDAEVGVVGGPLLYPDGRQLDFACDLDWFRDTIHLRPSCGRWRAIPTGVAYRVVDVVLNFALFRRELLQDHCWDDRLKLHEHEDFFLSVKQARRWRVAYCDLVKCNHIQDQSPLYAQYRGREKQFLPIIRAKWRILGFDPEPEVLVWDGLHQPDSPPPDVLLVGDAANVARLLTSAGWATVADSIARFNQHAMETGAFDTEEADRLLRHHPKPYLIHDPRWIHTLDKWMPVFARQAHPPLLVWLVPTTEGSSATEPGGVPPEVVDQIRARIYARWPWQKLRLTADTLADLLNAVNSSRSA